MKTKLYPTKSKLAYASTTLNQNRKFINYLNNHFRSSKNKSKIHLTTWKLRNWSVMSEASWTYLKIPKNSTKFNTTLISNCVRGSTFSTMIKYLTSSPLSKRKKHLLEFSGTNGCKIWNTHPSLIDVNRTEMPNSLNKLKQTKLKDLKRLWIKQLKPQVTSMK
jgi:hypothetical protein